MTKKDPAWVKYEERALIITRKTAPPFNQWAETMAAFNKLHESGGFYRGDLYLAGEQWYGENKATSIFEPTTWSVKTFQNNASVCRRIDASRRRDELSYSHHAEVAYLEEADDQDRYLQIAIDNVLGVRQLRELIRDDTGEEVKFNKRPLDIFLEQESQKIANRQEEAAGDVYNLMQTAVDSLADAAEIQRDADQMDQAA